jgi:hypothetical protein
MIDDDWAGGMLDENPRPKAREPNSAQASVKASMSQKGYRLGTLIPWDEVGTTVLWAAIAAVIFWWLVHR